MRAWFLVGWTAMVTAAWGCGPSEVNLAPDGPDDDLSDAPIFVRFDSRPRSDASLADAREVQGVDAPEGHDEPDADTGSTLSFNPPEAFVTRGGTATIQVILAEAPAEDMTIDLATTGSAASVPTSIFFPAGQASANVQVSGLTVGQVSVTASGSRALIHVVPPIVSLTPVGPTDLDFGSDQTFTVSLAEGPDIDVPVELTLDHPSVLTAATSVTIPARQTDANFTVHGAGLGVTAVHAKIGEDGPDATVRVKGLYLSEILYDPTGNDGGNEWIELRNDTDVTIDMTTINLAVATSLEFAIIVSFTETMAPGECAVYSMPPDSNDPTAGILGNGTDGDGIRLVVGADQVIDEVIYGDNNDDEIPDENGEVPADTDVADVASGKTIARDLDSPGRPWSTPASPSPNDCTKF